MPQLDDQSRYKALEGQMSPGPITYSSIPHPMANSADAPDALPPSPPTATIPERIVNTRHGAFPNYFVPFCYSFLKGYNKVNLVNLS